MCSVNITIKSNHYEKLEQYTFFLFLEDSIIYYIFILKKSPHRDKGIYLEKAIISWSRISNTSVRCKAVNFYFSLPRRLFLPHRARDEKLYRGLQPSLFPSRIII